MAEFPSDEELRKAGWIPRSRRARIILSRPRIRQIFWVDIYRDAFAPEFENEHPGIVIRAAASLNHDTCIVVPVTSQPQAEANFVHKLKSNPIPLGKAEGKDCYVICDHLYTVNVCRLRPIETLNGKWMFPLVDGDDFEAIIALIKKALAPAFDYKGSPVLADAATKTVGLAARTVGKDGRRIIGLPDKTEA